MTFVVPSIKNDRVEIFVKDETVYFKGNFDMQFPKDSVGVFLSNLHLEMLRHLKKVLHIDITEVEFVNSSAIREFLAWLMKLLSMPAENRYELFLFMSPDKLSQVSLGKSFCLLYPTTKLIDATTNISILARDL